MILVLGNSFERVKLNDLNDVIYYHQKKEFTDQEYSNSKDLQREIRSNRIIILETNLVRPSNTEMPGGLSKEDIHSTIKEALSRIPQAENIKNQDLKDIVKEILSEMNVKTDISSFIPVMIDAIRQEISKVSIQRSSGTRTTQSDYVDPGYIPTVNVDDMVSNIQHTEERDSGNLGDVGGALEALKRLTQSK